MTNRKTIELSITSEQAKELYETLIKWAGNEFAGRWFEGSLLDEFAAVMVDNQNWKINMSTGRPILARKYVYVYEKYLNCWSSELVLVMTDNNKKFSDFVKSRLENLDESDELDFENFCYESGLND